MPVLVMYLLLVQRIISHHLRNSSSLFICDATVRQDDMAVHDNYALNVH